MLYSLSDWPTRYQEKNATKRYNSALAVKSGIKSPNFVKAVINPTDLWFMLLEFRYSLEELKIDLISIKK